MEKVLESLTVTFPLEAPAEQRLGEVPSLPAISAMSSPQSTIFPKRCVEHAEDSQSYCGEEHGEGKKDKVRG